METQRTNDEGLFEQQLIPPYPNPRWSDSVRTNSGVVGFFGGMEGEMKHVILWGGWLVCNLSQWFLDDYSGVGNFLVVYTIALFSGGIFSRMEATK
jgi:hypothetical protein